MDKKFQHKVAVFFIILFMAIISAPSIIISIDDSVDITCFYGENEEEEKEGVKLLFEIGFEEFENYFLAQDKATNDGYTYKKYPKPHLNLISPPPEKILA